MARDKQNADMQKTNVQKAYGHYSATEQGDRRRAHDNPEPDAAPGQKAERGAYDPDHEYRRYEQPDRKPPKAQPKIQPKIQPKTKATRDLGKRLSELS